MTNNNITIKGHIQSIDQFIENIENLPNFREIADSPMALSEIGEMLLNEIRLYNPSFTDHQIEAGLSELQHAYWGHTWFVHTLGFAKLAMRPL